DNSGMVGLRINAYLSKCLSLQERQSGQVIYPTTGFGSGVSLSTTIAAENIDDDVVSGKKLLIVRGCFVYRTFEQVRLSAFCYFYRGDMTKAAHLNICTGGNYAD